MDENLEDKSNEISDNLENSAHDATDQIEDAYENVWESLAESTEEVADAAQNASNMVEGAAEDAAETVSEASDANWEDVEEASEIIDESTETVVEGSWRPVEEVSTPEIPSEPGQPATVEPPIYEEVKSVNAEIVPDQDKKAKKDKGFPIWLIILLILLVVCLCVVLPVALVLGGFWTVFQNAIGGASALLAFLIQAFDQKNQFWGLNDKSVSRVGRIHNAMDSCYYTLPGVSPYQPDLPDKKAKLKLITRQIVKDNNGTRIDFFL